MTHALPDQVVIFLPDDAATTAFGRWMATGLRGGDVVYLAGGIGAGKTHFARAIIRARVPQALDVPSPTFTLVQSYEAADVTILHADLYRLSHPDEVAELGLGDTGPDVIRLIEWPEGLHLHFAVDGDARRVTAQGLARLVARVAAFPGGAA
jgi:tRNA threonylcarbamoyladenosine biosynthesis protein TsaE